MTQAEQELYKAKFMAMAKGVADPDVIAQIPQDVLLYATQEGVSFDPDSIVRYGRIISAMEKNPKLSFSQASNQIDGVCFLDRGPDLAA
jgi:hypothetical protein